VAPCPRGHGTSGDRSREKAANETEIAACREASKRSLREPTHAQRRANAISRVAKVRFLSRVRMIEKSNAFHIANNDAVIDADIDANIKSI